MGLPVDKVNVIRRRLLRTLCPAVLVCLSVTGCTTPGLGRGGPPIARLVMFHELTPWLNLDPGRDAEAEGFSFFLYLFSAKGGRGVHRDGIIHIEIFRRIRTANGDSRRELVDTWTYPTSEVHYSKTPNQYFGHYYRVDLSWIPYDLSGTELEIEIRFEDEQGRVTYATRKNLLVPKKAFR